MAREGRELFYLKDHLIQDAEAHDAILNDGDDAAARKISAKIAKRLGLTDAEIEALFLSTKGASDDRQPRNG